MENNNRGTFYSSGFCYATQENCGYDHEGHCGICKTGAAARRRLSSLEDDDESPQQHYDTKP
jgi:hypothetical protein